MSDVPNGKDLTKEQIGEQLEFLNEVISAAQSSALEKAAEKHAFRADRNELEETVKRLAARKNRLGRSEEARFTAIAITDIQKAIAVINQFVIKEYGY